MLIFEFTFLTPEDIQAINKQYLNHDYPTDIISFNLSDEDEPIHGDIYICPRIAKKNALAYKSTFENEIKLLIVHGILHLLGYEDYTDAQKAKMDLEQTRIINSIKDDISNA